MILEQNRVKPAFPNSRLGLIDPSSRSERSRSSNEPRTLSRSENNRLDKTIAAGLSLHQNKKFRGLFWPRPRHARSAHVTTRRRARSANKRAHAARGNSGSIIIALAWSVTRYLGARGRYRTGRRDNKLSGPMRNGAKCAARLAERASRVYASAGTHGRALVTSDSARLGVLSARYPRPY